MQALFMKLVPPSYRFIFVQQWPQKSAASVTEFKM
jgi:hypothetical protein